MYHIIVNFHAGKNRVRRNLALLEQTLSERSEKYEVHVTSCEGDAVRIAAEITAGHIKSEGVNEETGAEEEIALAEAERTDEASEAGEEPIIVILGGDGTLHEVLNGLSDPTKCKLGLIPSGTGNDFAAAAGIPEDAETAITLLLDGEAKPTDYLTVGGKRCMNVAGLGMDVDVLVRCGKGRMKGKAKYLISLLQSLFAFRGYNVTLEAEGRKESRKSLIVAACNGTQIGGGIRICPVSVIDDGKIDVMTVKYLTIPQVIKAFWYLMRGKVTEYPSAEHFLCEELKVVSEKPCTVQLDGELYDNLPFEVKIERGLKIFR